MAELNDPEFGTITIRSNTLAKHIRIKVAPNGRYSVSAPPHTPQFVIKRFINSQRSQIRALADHHIPETIYTHGTQIGKSHTLLVQPTSSSKPAIHIDGQQIILQLPAGVQIEEEGIQRLIRDTAIKTLRIEAKRYLPRRLKFLADKGGYTYERVRFSHAGSRWGSCSSNGTISLNIALMKLPFELIDYVIIHELAHTVQMNHSNAFWEEVGRLEPSYRVLRQALKRESPTI